MEDLKEQRLKIDKIMAILMDSKISDADYRKAKKLLDELKIFLNKI